MNIDSPKVRGAVIDARQHANLNSVRSDRLELATITDEAHVGEPIVRVSECAIRVEQLHWLAQDRAPVQYSDRVRERVDSLALERDWTVTHNAPLPMSAGRSRRVTAVVQTGDVAAYVQVLSLKTADQAVANCYYIFDRAEVPIARRVAALDGIPGDWPSGIDDDLAQVGRVTFFGAARELERELDRIAGSTPLAQL